MNLLEVATRDRPTRLATTFTEDEHGRRPVFGGIEKFQNDPHWHDLLLFHEYFHGDNGAGIGASHQTGWTGTVALLFLLGDALHARPRRDRRRRRVSRCRAPAPPPDRLRDQHGGLAAAARPRARAPARARRGARRRVGRAGRAAGRRRLADGRLAAQPRRPARSRWPIPALDAANRAALPDLRAEDVIGSPYCVRDYVVDERFGGPDGAGARRASSSPTGGWG